MRNAVTAVAIGLSVWIVAEAASPPSARMAQAGWIDALLGGALQTAAVATAADLRVAAPETTRRLAGANAVRFQDAAAAAAAQTDAAPVRAPAPTPMLVRLLEATGPRRSKAGPRPANGL